MVRLIITIVVAVLVLSFFGISIRAIIESPAGHDNIQYVWQLITDGWDTIVAWFENFAEPLRFPR